jgi:hypothetical protein
MALFMIFFCSLNLLLLNRVNEVIGECNRDRRDTSRSLTVVVRSRGRAFYPFNHPHPEINEFPQCPASDNAWLDDRTPFHRPPPACRRHRCSRPCQAGVPLLPSPCLLRQDQARRRHRRARFRPRLGRSLSPSPPPFSCHRRRRIRLQQGRHPSPCF